MKQSIGSTAAINIAFTFIAIVFAFLAGTLSYYKAFKINNIITTSIEKMEGFNDKAIAEINSKLSSIGYEQSVIECPFEKKFNNISYYSDVHTSSVNGVCVYYYYNSDKKTYQYGITTYMTINIPIISNILRMPINTITQEIYGCFGVNNFDDSNDICK